MHTVREFEHLVYQFPDTLPVLVEDYLSPFYVRLVFHQSRHLVGVGAYFVDGDSPVAEHLGQYRLPSDGFVVHDAGSRLPVNLLDERRGAGVFLRRAL